MPKHIKRLQTPGQEHFRSALRREGMLTPSFLRVWDAVPWKEKVELPGMRLRGRRYPGGQYCEGGVLSESLWERLAQHTHLNCPLRFRLHQRTLQEESWTGRCLSLIPENEKHPSSPPEAGDIKVFNEVFQRGSSSTMNVWRPLLGEFQCLWHPDYLQRLRHARWWVLKRAHGKFQEANS